jgi:hypothetical protein
MRVPRLQPPELGEIATRACRKHRAPITHTSVHASIAEDHRAIGRNQGEGVEDVSELFRGKVGDRSTLAPHTPGREIANDPHRRRWRRTYPTLVDFRRNEGKAERKNGNENQTWWAHDPNLLDNSKRWL